jgi:hypothetical protein
VDQVEGLAEHPVGVAVVYEEPAVGWDASEHVGQSISMEKIYELTDQAESDYRSNVRFIVEGKCITNRPQVNSKYLRLRILIRHIDAPYASPTSNIKNVEKLLLCHGSKEELVV